MKMIGKFLGLFENYADFLSHFYHLDLYQAEHQRQNFSILNLIIDAFKHEVSQNRSLYPTMIGFLKNVNM